MGKDARWKERPVQRHRGHQDPLVVICAQGTKREVGYERPRIQAPFQRGGTSGAGRKMKGKAREETVGRKRLGVRTQSSSTTAGPGPRTLDPALLAAAVERLMPGQQGDRRTVA